MKTSPTQMVLVLGVLCLPWLALSASADKSSARTVQQIMDSEIDPAADAIWDSVGEIENKAGRHQRQPKNTRQWQALAATAERLVRGASALSQTRNVGSNGHGLLADAETPGIRTAAQIARDIQSDPGRFAAAALRLRDAGVAAKSAIAARDPQKLLAAGAAMDAACEACHAAYWYPRTKPLALPSDGVFSHFPERHASQPPRPATPN